jgi:hypothetical protein
MCNGNNGPDGGSAVLVASRVISDALVNAAGLIGIFVSVDHADELVHLRLNPRQATDVASLIKRGAGVAV